MVGTEINFWCEERFQRDPVQSIMYFGSLMNRPCYGTPITLLTRIWQTASDACPSGLNQISLFQGSKRIGKHASTVMSTRPWRGYRCARPVTAAYCSLLIRQSLALYCCTMKQILFVIVPLQTILRTRTGRQTGQNTQ